MLKMPDITTLPGGRKVRTDLRPYADDVVEAEAEPAPEPVKPKRKPRPKKAKDNE